MVRKKLKELHKEDGFELRGKGATRIEALSDGVFAIAIALLLISADTPTRFSELKEFMYDFVPFGGTIAILMVIWYQHYLFFLRYGLQDSNTVTINTVLLFLILFYVYPLKFLFRTLYTLFSGIITEDRESLEYLFSEIVPRGDGPELMIIYGSGGVFIFLTLAALYWRAYILRDRLELSELERFDTRASVYLNLAQAAIALTSILVAAFEIGGRMAFMVSGMTYWLYLIVMPVMGISNSRRRKKLLERLANSD